MLLLILALIALTVAGSGAIIGLDIQRIDSLPPHSGRSGRRQVSQTLDNFQSLYFANITLGTPPQRLRMHLDTGSSDLWCNSLQSSLCSTRGQYCNVSGTYDATVSSSYHFVNHDFNISYADGTGALGDYVTDTIGIGGRTINDFQFGVGIRSTSTEGVLGIGYALNEVQVNRGNGQPYDNLPQRMVNGGLIKSNAYSLWLNDLDANTGQILFGGVNTDKYHGSLQTIPILQVAGQYAEMLVALSIISLSGSSIPSSSLPGAVLLDSGTTLMYLPNDVARYIYNQVRATTDTNSGRIVAYVPCALAGENRTIDFTFSGIKISVPFNELVLHSTAPDGSDLEFDDGTPACVFGIAPSGGATSVLGDTFLRSAYVVYDLANNQISLAQTNFNSTTDHIKEIEVGANGVPDATTVPDPLTTAKGVARGAARLDAAAATPTGSVTSGAPEQAKVLADLSLMLTFLAAIGSAA